MAKRGNSTLEGFLSPMKALLWAVVVVIALFAFYGFIIFLVEVKNSIQLITILAWPTVVVIVLIAFRKPLTDFLQGIAGRITKVSITQIFSVELSLPEASQPTLDQFRQTLLQKLASGEIISDSLGPLLEQIQSDKSVDYMIIDLEQKWLTSRLFIFALMLERMRGLQCLVFLGTQSNIPRSFLGIALPSEVRWKLAQKYPWLEEHFIRAQIDLYDKQFLGNKDLLLIQSKQGALQPSTAATLVSTFLDRIQEKGRAKTDPPSPPKEWKYLEKGQQSASYWEHAKWIDEARLANDLGDALHTSEEVWFKDSLDISQTRRGPALLRREGSSFVALIDRKGVFKSLIDRQVLLEQVAERVERVSDDH